MGLSNPLRETIIYRKTRGYVDGSMAYDSTNKLTRLRKYWPGIGYISAQQSAQAEDDETSKTDWHNSRASRIDRGSHWREICANQLEAGACDRI